MQANDNKVMREALVKIYHEIRAYCVDYGAGESHESLVDRTVDDPPDYTCYRDSILEIDRIVEAALAKPPRQCDVGTAEDQNDRFNLYCDEHGRYCDGSPKCNDCPLLKQMMTNGGKCEFIWAQMPYGAERK